MSRRQVNRSLTGERCPKRRPDNGKGRRHTLHSGDHRQHSHGGSQAAAQGRERARVLAHFLGVGRLKARREVPRGVHRTNTPDKPLLNADDTKGHAGAVSAICSDTPTAR
jgi:hypothetical protein